MAKETDARPPRLARDATVDDQISSLMADLKEEAVALKCRQEQVLSDWQIGLDALAGKMATLQPLMNKSMQGSADRERALSRIAAAEKDLKHRLAQAERDLAHYQPMAIQQESELRSLRHALGATQSAANASETECRRALGMVNDLQQRLATSEATRQKLQEENVSSRQRLQKHDLTLPAMVREIAQLKSELSVSNSDREHLEGDLSTLQTKFAVQAEENTHNKELVTQLQARLSQIQAESQARIAEAEERAAHAGEKLVGHEQQVHELEIRQSALLSKIDFLNRINQRQRDDLRRQNDHIGNLEASNRQLLDTAPPTPAPQPAPEEAVSDAEGAMASWRAAGE